MLLAEFLGRRQTRQHLLEVLVSAVIMGGVFVAPVACVAAMIGVAFPGSSPLHRAGAQVFGFAVLWFVLALFCAHAQARSPQKT